ncbi:MAG: Hpt domain-containing protein [Ekhidna sp.]|nr:Hpt domain-containing protein [Ekhidna sp.]
MKSKEEEYQQLFLTEALEISEQLNKFFVDLEKDHQNKKVITNIFRIIHTLKGNALGMGYESIADLAHVMEDIFGAIKENEVAPDAELVDSLFRANDKLGALINSLNSGEKVSYLGIKTKLAVFLKNAREQRQQQKNAKNQEHKEPELGSEDQDKKGDAEDSSITFAEVVQIPVRKMDELLNVVGELVIERDRLISHFENKGQSTLEFEGLKRISANLHYGIMSARMVQMGFLFNKFHRVLRDAAVSEKKDVKLRLKGTEVEIDRNILKIISDSLVHVVRNAVSHGIESMEERKKSKKPAMATVTLEANLEKDNVVLSVSDDGRGINTDKIKEKIIAKKMITESSADELSEQEIIRYIFEPGFSSAEKVTEISGRGVGMDIVKRSVESIGGQVLIDTKIGEGSSFHLVLPSSLALKGSLLFEVSSQEYAIPLTYIESVNYYKKEDIHNIGNSLMINYNDQSVSLIFLAYLFKAKDIKSFTNSRLFNERLKSLAAEEQISVIMAKHSGRYMGLVVDKLLRQKEIIEKKLPRTILGSGNVCPVVDVAAIMDFLYKSSVKAQAVWSF